MEGKCLFSWTFLCYILSNYLSFSVFLCLSLSFSLFHYLSRSLTASKPHPMLPKTWNMHIIGFDFVEQDLEQNRFFPFIELFLLCKFVGLWYNLRVNAIYVNKRKIYLNWIIRPKSRSVRNCTFATFLSFI